ncbi:PREDICTED: 7-methylguanosine phosphate-specific 5'-nucleotidase [Nicrophorus vespilloides]|uniref:5'-nucleotidase n=1 Tax=Nicrophorus vespilloides TaxID=110193 RepID=A0ABM1N622_NICVS|nr:PREDICTED: 7-methylguanosine phosphate-specific 5'-nucleotidase [Nicrophorus vespilloides]
MKRDYVRELKALSGDKIHIKDEENVNRLIGAIVSGGKEKLQVVSDFDRTITKQHENGKSHLSSFGIFACCDSLPESYKVQEKTLKDKYLPIENDPKMPLPEKTKYMEEWWAQSEEILKGVNVTDDDIEEAVRNFAPALRDGTRDAIVKLDKMNVPVLVFSAGLGNAVVAVLDHFKVNLPNVKIISNFLKRDDQGVIQGFSDKMINVFNKNETAIVGSDYYHVISDRVNIILLGDSQGDANMAEGMPNVQAVLKIGFIFEHIEDNLPSYMDKFDLVLDDDQTMDVLNKLLSFMSE